MKSISFLIILMFLVIGCREQENEREFLSSFETSTLTADGKEINFRVVYSAKILEKDEQVCLTDSNEEFDELIAKPLITSFIRSYIGTLDSGEITTVDEDIVKREFNKDLASDRVTIQSENFKGCSFSITTLAMNQQE